MILTERFPLARSIARAEDRHAGNANQRREMRGAGIVADKGGALRQDRCRAKHAQAAREIVANEVPTPCRARRTTSARSDRRWPAARRSGTAATTRSPRPQSVPPATSWTAGRSRGRHRPAPDPAVRRGHSGCRGQWLARCPARPGEHRRASRRSRWDRQCAAGEAPRARRALEPRPLPPATPRSEPRGTVGRRPRDER